MIMKTSELEVVIANKGLTRQQIVKERKLAEGVFCPSSQLRWFHCRDPGRRLQGDLTGVVLWCSRNETGVSG